MKIRPFFIVAFGIIGLLHLYIGYRILPDLPGPSGVLAVGAAWLALSGVLVPAALLAHGLESRRQADLLAWAGFLAMGLFSSLLVLTLLRDVAFMLAWLLDRLALLAASATFAPNSAVAVVLGAAAMTGIGFLNARRRARVVEVQVPIANLPPALQGFAIAQISDLHVGPTIKRGYVQAVVQAVNALNADVVALTGDLVDGTVEALAAHTAPLGLLRGKLGVYAVTGNHEYYSGAPEWITEYQRLGLTVLNNQHVLLEHGGAQLALAGVPDYSAHLFIAEHRSDPHRALAGAPGEALKVLLAHQPRTIEAAAAAGVDLQLSGHTHGGQFLPWNLLVPMQQPYVAGLHRHGRAWIYTSRGTGYWGPPLRFGAPSEITLLRLVAAA